MRRSDVHFAAAARDDGIRKISKLTWRAGAAGVVCSALIAAAFGHRAAAQPAGTAQQPRAGVSNHGSGNHRASTHGASNHGVSSHGATGTNGGGGASSGSQGTIVVPAQPPAPAAGGGQVTSGGS